MLNVSSILFWIGYNNSLSLLKQFTMLDIDHFRFMFLSGCICRYMCALVCTCTHMCMWKSEDKLCWFTDISHLLRLGFSLDWNLAELLGSLARPRHSPVPASHSHFWIIKGVSCHPSWLFIYLFYIDSRDLDSGPHSKKTTALSIEPSISPALIVLFNKGS